MNWIIMPVFVRPDVKKWQVGFFDPTDSFYPHGEPHEHIAQAEAHVHYLNGGLWDELQVRNSLHALTRELQNISAQLRNIR